jgi:hypothetical protein
MKDMSEKNEVSRCDCCGKHMSELKPYGKAGDPLVGDLNGELLVNAAK